MYYVAIYETNQEYGGPEEGGWWYDTGERVTDPVAFATRDEAVAYADTLRPEVAEMNEGRYRPSSVMCNGWFAVEWHRDESPEFYPAERPYYE
jgi:hypothetical protein